MSSAGKIIPDIKITFHCLSLEEQMQQNPISEETYIPSILKRAVSIAVRQLIRKLTRNTHIATQKYAKWKPSLKFQVFGGIAQRGVTSGEK
jgi:hypothetical protein